MLVWRSTPYTHTAPLTHIHTHTAPLIHTYTYTHTHTEELVTGTPILNTQELVTGTPILNTKYSGFLYTKSKHDRFLFVRTDSYLPF